MKIMFGITAVVGVLLAMIVGIGHMDGLVLGEPSDETEVSATPVERVNGQATGEEEGFLNFVVGYVVGTGNAVNQVGGLLAEPAPDEMAWQMEMGMLLSKIRSTKDAITEVVPPPALQEFHDASVQVLAHCSAFAVLMGETINAGEIEPSEEANAELLQADELFGEMDRLLMEFLKEHPMPQQECGLGDSSSCR